MKFFVILLAVLTTFATIVQPANSTSAGAAASTPLVGKYDGSMVGDARGGQNAFWVAIDQQTGETLSGKANFHYGLPACRGVGALSFTGTIRDGVIVLNIEGRTSGCERVITVRQVAEGQLAGTLSPQDGVRTVPLDVVLTRAR